MDLTNIFLGKEVTVTKNEAYIDRWHPKRTPIEISIKLANYLINMNVLEENGGNFSTGETHYDYNKYFGRLMQSSLEELAITNPDNWAILELNNLTRHYRLVDLTSS